MPAPIVDAVRLTERLRLVPIGPAHAGELWSLHWDAAIAPWYGGRWTAQMAIAYAERAHAAWRSAGVHKWMAYDRASGELVGRGGLSRIELAGRERLEVGWALRGARWGAGYATEIGRAALDLAFGELAAAEVIAYPERQNARSSAVMRRIGMRFDRELALDGQVFVLYAARRPPAGDAR